MKLNFSDFATYADFDQEVLREIIRDGETEMRARLDTANAADVRIVTLVGFQLTIAIAMAGAALTLVKVADQISLALVAVFVMLGMVVASYYGLKAATPTLFCFPGNDPKNWSFRNWCTPLKSPSEAKLKAALVEQCFTLHTGIYDNKIAMEESAWQAKVSIRVMFVSIFVASIVASVNFASMAI